MTTQPTSAASSCPEVTVAETKTVLGRVFTNSKGWFWELPLANERALRIEQDANLALDKFREALTGDDSECLTPVKEGWGS